MPKNEDPHINPLGFREYDARWLYPKDINKEGIRNVGRGFGSQIISKINKRARVIVGHDYRSYSEEVKKNFIDGLISTGCNVEDIGLCLSPTVYFSQFKLNSDAVAMITASHNENGWTGIKMGIEKGLTHCKEEMLDLKEIVLNEKFTSGSGKYKEIKNFNKIYKGLTPFEDKIILPQATPNSDPSWFCFLITVRENAGFIRNDITGFLEQNGIETRNLFAGNLTRQPAFQDKPFRIIGNLGNTDYIMNNTFFIGVYPGIDDAQIEYMLDTFTKFFQNN